MAMILPLRAASATMNPIKSFSQCVSDSLIQRKEIRLFDYIMKSISHKGKRVCVKAHWVENWISAHPAGTCGGRWDWQDKVPENSAKKNLRDIPIISQSRGG